MSLDDKIAQIMSGNFLADSPITRRTPVTVFKSNRVLSPISSPISNVNPLGTFSTDGLSAYPSVRSPSPIISAERIKSPITGITELTSAPSKTLEEMLSDYRASKNSSKQDVSEDSRTQLATPPMVPPSPSMSADNNSSVVKQETAKTGPAKVVIPSNLSVIATSSKDEQMNKIEGDKDLPKVMKDTNAPTQPAVTQSSSRESEFRQKQSVDKDDESVVEVDEDNFDLLDTPSANRTPANKTEINPQKDALRAAVEVSVKESSQMDKIPDILPQASRSSAYTPSISTAIEERQPDIKQDMNVASMPPKAIATSTLDFEAVKVEAQQHASASPIPILSKGRNVSPSPKPEQATLPQHVDPLAQTIRTQASLPAKGIAISASPTASTVDEKEDAESDDEPLDMEKLAQHPVPPSQIVSRKYSDDSSRPLSVPPSPSESAPKKIQGGRVMKPHTAKPILDAPLPASQIPAVLSSSSSAPSSAPSPAPSPVRSLSPAPSHSNINSNSTLSRNSAPVPQKVGKSEVKIVDKEIASSNKSVAKKAPIVEPATPVASKVTYGMTTPVKETPRKPLSTALYTPSTAGKSSSTVLHANPVNARPMKLAVRIRPFSDFEKMQKARRTISKGQVENEIVVVNPNAFDANPDSVANAAKVIDNKQWAQSFRFDSCLWKHDTSSDESHYAGQDEVHETLGMDIVDNVLNGVSCSCFAYGHTSTGKTYSLFGDSSKKGTSKMGITSESGLVPRVFKDIINSIKVNRNIQHGSRIFISYLEIYNEHVVDLLDDTPVTKAVMQAKDIDALKVREHPAYGPYVEGLKKSEIFSVEDMFELIAKCQKKRSSTQTAWNSHSSRSHAVVTLEVTNADLSAVTTTPLDTENKQEVLKKITSVGNLKKSELDAPIVKVQMVDLAGSEKDSLREDEESSAFTSYADSPSKLSEAADREKNELKLIRRSLATLGFIIQSLAKGATFRTLPYRDSVLTFLLRDALNGYNHTTMLATISPAHMHYEETLSTLRYAEKLTLVRKKNHHAVGDDHSFLDEMETSRGDMVEEFRTFHSDVKKGSLAARQMLQYTVADPRQRIAKLTQNSQQLIPVTPRASKPLTEVTFTSPLDGKVKRLTDLNGDDLEHLQSSYRNLQGQVIEMQIDLDAIKTDRDTLMVELRSARDQLNEAEKAKEGAEGKMQGAMKAVKVAEKELAENRLQLRRREENIERLLADISEQKQARANAEQAYHARTKEFLARFDTLKKENKAMESALELANNRDGAYGAQKMDFMTQIDKLKTQVEQLNSSLITVQEENNSLKSVHTDLEVKVITAEEWQMRYNALEAEFKSVCTSLENLRHEAEMMRSERDSLAAIVKQKDSLLWLQGQQSEMSIKMLQQRQAALERSDSSGVNVEDWKRLTESLRDLFTHEGQVLYSELMDTKKLTQMVRDLREKMSLYDSVQQQLDMERGARRELERQLATCVQSLRDHDQQREDFARLINALQQELHDCTKLGYVRRSLPSSLFTPPSQLYASKDSVQQRNSLAEQQCEQYKAENSDLRSQLEIAQRETSSARDESQKAQSAAQKDLASLWNALQELNKLDALKDKSIQDLVTERAKLASERDAAIAEARQAKRQCEELRKELDEVDKDLVKAVTASSRPSPIANVAYNFPGNQTNPRQGDAHMNQYTADSYPSSNTGFYNPNYGNPALSNPFNNLNNGNDYNNAMSNGNMNTSWPAPPPPSLPFQSTGSSNYNEGYNNHFPQQAHRGGQDKFNYDSTPQLGRSQNGRNYKGEAEPLSEEILEKQIDELSGFLSSDSRSRRSGSGVSNTAAKTPNSSARPTSAAKNRPIVTPPPLPSFNEVRGAFSNSKSTQPSATKRAR